MVKVSAILLGAGESKRMGTNKLALPWRNKTVFEQCLDTLLHSEVEEIVVVLSKNTKAMRSQLQSKDVKVVMNRFFKRGMSTSIREGMKAIDPGNEGILIALGDQPLLKTRTVNALIHAFTKGGYGIIVPSFRRRRGNPVLFHRKYEKELMKLKGDAGGRSLIDRHIEDVGVIPVRSEGVVRDIDTRDEYQKGRPFGPRKAC